MGKTESSGKGRPEKAVSWPDDSCPNKIPTTVVFPAHKQDWGFSRLRRTSFQDTACLHLTSKELPPLSPFLPQVTVRIVIIAMFSE